MLTQIFILLLAPLLAYNCPETISTQEKAINAHQWLTKWEHLKNLGTCEVEITTCEVTNEFNNSAPIAEVLITDSKGREAYVSIDFPFKKQKRFKTKVITNERTFYYRKKDRFYEPVNGRTEVWRLEMRTNWYDTDHIEVIDLGIYSTNNQLNQPNGNDSHWFNCFEASAEDEIDQRK